MMTAAAVNFRERQNSSTLYTSRRILKYAKASTVALVPRGKDRYGERFDRDCHPSESMGPINPFSNKIPSEPGKIGIII